MWIPNLAFSSKQCYESGFPMINNDENVLEKNYGRTWKFNLGNVNAGTRPTKYKAAQTQSEFTPKQQDAINNTDAIKSQVVFMLPRHYSIEHSRRINKKQNIRDEHRTNLFKHKNKIKT